MLVKKRLNHLEKRMLVIVEALSFVRTALREIRRWGVKMPNWCNNSLTIGGDKKEIKKFKDFAKGKNRYGKFDWLQANNFIPYPKDLEEKDMIAHNWREKANAYAEKLAGVKEWWCGDKLTKKQRDAFIKKNGEEPKDGFNQGGYEWCSKNWGTKWGFCDVEKPQDYGDMLVYTFDTAWAPPIPLIANASKRFPKLKFELLFEEPGMCFAGEMVCENGKVKEIVDRTTHYCPSCYEDMEVLDEKAEKYECSTCEKKLHWNGKSWTEFNQKTKRWTKVKTDKGV